MNQHRFPRLVEHAIKYLTPPPSSVPSEQWFSVVTEIYGNKKRNRLSLKAAQKMLFLKKCLPMIDWKYTFMKNDLNDDEEAGPKSNVSYEFDE